mgnify:CR=1 FL=1
MNIQNRQIETYNMFTTQSERTGQQRVVQPPGRAQTLETPVNTGSGNSLTDNPVEFSQFEAFQSLLRRELVAPTLQQDAELNVFSKDLETIAEDIRNGTYRVDSTATAMRLNNLELLLR